MKVFPLLALCSFSCCLSAWPQAHPTSNDVPSAEQARAEIFGGFALVGGSAPTNSGGNSTGVGWGFNAGADFHLAPHIFAVANVMRFPISSSGSAIDATSDTMFVFGPRYLVRIRSAPRASVFGEFLAGANTYHNDGQPYTWAYNNATNFAFTADGGVDWSVARRLGIRFEAGYLRTRFTVSTFAGPANPAYVTDNLGQFAVDLVYRF